MAARRAGFAWPKTSGQPADPASQELATTLRDVRNAKLASILLSEPPSPEEEVEAEGMRGLLKAAMEDILRKARAGEKVTETDFDTILAKGANRALGIQLIQGLTGGGQPTAPAPAPASEIIQAATSANKIHADAAALALQREEAARKELARVTSEHNQTVAAAVEDERKQGLTMAALLERILKNESENRVAATIAEKNSAVEEIRRLAVDATAAKDQQIELLKVQHAQALQIQAKDHAHALVIRDKDDALQKALAAATHTETVQETWERAQLETNIASLKTAAKQAEARGDLQNDILKDVKNNVLPEVTGALKMGASALLGLPIDVASSAPPRPEEDAPDGK